MKDKTFSHETEDDQEVPTEITDVIRQRPAADERPTQVGPAPQQPAFEQVKVSNPGKGDVQDSSGELPEVPTYSQKVQSVSGVAGILWHHGKTVTVVVTACALLLIAVIIMFWWFPQDNDEIVTIQASLGDDLARAAANAHPRSDADSAQLVMMTTTQAAAYQQQLDSFGDRLGNLERAVNMTITEFGKLSRSKPRTTDNIRCNECTTKNNYAKCVEYQIRNPVSRLELEVLYDGSEAERRADIKASCAKHYPDSAPTGPST